MFNNKINVRGTFLFIIILACFGCTEEMTESHRKYIHQCVNNSSEMLFVDLEFMGFQKPIDSIEVRRYFKDEKYRDSFYIKLFQCGNAYNNGINTKSAYIKQLPLDFIYNFMIPEQKPYQLKNIKLKVYTEEKKGASFSDCSIGHYEIDGNIFEDERKLIFHNREDKTLLD
jgi:hypothetical protein